METGTRALKGWGYGLLLGALAAASTSASFVWAQAKPIAPASSTAQIDSPATFSQRVSLESRHTLRLDASGKAVSLYTEDQQPSQLRVWSLPQQRLGATLTRMADGKVLIWGGADSKGGLVEGGLLIDPSQEGIQSIAPAGLQARARHSVTVLTDGSVFLAGGKGHPDQAQRWNPQTQAVVTLSMPARLGHQATLQADGQVRLSGGTDADGVSRGDLLFNPSDDTFSPAPPTWTAPKQTALAASLPNTKATDVDPGVRVAVRFTRPVRMQDVKDNTISLMGPAGLVEARVTSAEGGRLVFIQPDVPLFPDTDYTVLVEGLKALGGESLPLAVIEFKTRAVSGASQPGTSTGKPLSATAKARQMAALLGCGKDHPQPCHTSSSMTEGAWRPGQDSTDARWRVTGAQPEALPIGALEVAAIASGRTSLSGRLLLVNSQPIAGVEVSVGSIKTKTDPSGRFVLSGLPNGRQELYVDGSSADVAGREYGQFVVGVDLKAGQLTRLPYTMYVPQISARDKTSIDSPLKRDVVLTHPDIPGLQVHIPAGTVIRDRKGNLVHELAIVPTPVNRAPFPVAANYPVYFTLEPGGAVVQGLTPEAAKGVKVLYPNYDKLPTGTQANFWIYDPMEGWRVYGKGRVTTDGTRLAPESGVALHQTMGASYSMDTTTPGSESDKPAKSCPCGCDCAAGAVAGDPIDLYTGEFSYEETDAVVGGLVPISVGRAYRPRETLKRDFGIATAANFRFTFYSPTTDYNQLQLVQPNGTHVPFDRVSGSGLTGQWAQSGSMTAYAGATITQGTPSGHGYLMVLRDGSKMYFNQYAPNNLEWTLDRFGNRVDYVYDAGLVSRVVSANGRYLALTYDSENRISTVKDSLSNTWSYTYNDDGYLSKVTRPDGSTRTFNYKVRDKNTLYEKQVRLESIYDGKNQRVLLNEFQDDYGTWTGKVVKQTQADGGVLTINYVHVDGGTTGVLATRPDGSKRRIVFDPVSHYPKTSTLAYGTSLAQTTTYERGAGGQVSAWIDALGRRTEYSYDGAGRTTQIKAMAGTSQARTVTLAYNSDGDLASITDPLGHKTSFGYTSRCLTSVTNALGKVTKATCNAAGQRLTLTDALGHATTYTWTGEDLAQISDALGRKVKFRYDVLGRVIAAEDAQGNVSRLEYDGLSRVTKSVDPLGNTVQTGFDVNGNVSAVLLPHGNGVTYTYDARDRRITRTDALSQVEKWTYDTMDRVKTYTDRRNRVTSYAYDTLGRLTTTTFPGSGGTLTSAYDAGDRLTSLIDSISGTLGWTYDNFDAVTQANSPQGTIYYTYDAAGRRTNMQAASQTQVQYNYDNADRLLGIAQGTEAVTFAYDNANRLTTTTLPNQVQTVYTYNDADQVTGLAWGKAGQTALGSLGYGYDSSGQLVAQTGTHAPQSLPSASTNNTFDDNNRQAKANNVALSYDSNGNLISDGSRTYVWDDRDRLIQIKSGSTIIASFSYDALGRRIAKTEGGTTTNYLYDGLDAVQETQGTTVNPILTGGGIDQRYARNETSGRTYFLTDQLGSTRLLTDTSGAVVQRYDYDPYGVTTQTSAGITNPYQYTGREKDQSGLYYYRARYYQPGWARFISEDPIQLAAGPNSYMYVRGKPLSSVDPLGLRDYSDECVGRYAFCKASQDPNGSTFSNWLKFKGCKAVVDGAVDKAPSKPAGKAIACQADYHDCTGGSNFGDPNLDPRDPVVLQCNADYFRCVSK